MRKNTSGILLCGGESSRFQNNKIQIRLNKIPLFIDQIVKLSFFCDEILIITNIKNFKIISNEFEKIENYLKFYDGLEVKIPFIRLMTDNATLTENNTKSIGPIAGICTGLLEAKNQYCIVQAFDMPFTSYNLFKLLTEKNSNGFYDLIIIKTDQGIETLSAVYSKNCIETILKNIENKIYRIIDIFPYLKVNWITEEDLEKYSVDKLNFFNINMAEDHTNFKKIWKSENFVIKKDVVQNSDNKNWGNFFYRGSGKLNEKIEIYV